MDIALIVNITLCVLSFLLAAISVIDGTHERVVHRTEGMKYMFSLNKLTNSLCSQI